MIHALLFVTKYDLPHFCLLLSSLSHLSHNDDHDDHGPNFKNLMLDINNSTIVDQYRPADGYNISVYHNFVDEADYHRQHHWECDRCHRVKKRSMNRAPSEKDCLRYRKDESGWMAQCPPDRNRCGLSRCDVHDHMRECGGEWIKIREPSLKTKRKDAEMASQLSQKKQKKIESFYSGKRPEKAPEIHEVVQNFDKVLVDLTQGEPSMTANVSDSIFSLVQMGFDETRSRDALERASYDVTQAIAYLLEANDI